MLEETGGGGGGGGGENTPDRVLILRVLLGFNAKGVPRNLVDFAALSRKQVFRSGSPTMHTVDEIAPLLISQLLIFTMDIRTRSSGGVNSCRGTDETSGCSY
jgi:hypothetical protein